MQAIAALLAFTLLVGTARCVPHLPDLNQAHSYAHLCGNSTHKPPGDVLYMCIDSSDGPVTDIIWNEGKIDVYSNPSNSHQFAIVLANKDAGVMVQTAQHMILVYGTNSVKDEEPVREGCVGFYVETLEGVGGDDEQWCPGQKPAQLSTTRKHGHAKP